MTAPDPPRVLIRIVTSPQPDRDELLAVYVESRTTADPNVLVYSCTRDQWRVEHHRRLMWRTRRASPTERAVALETLTQIGERVRILSAAPRAYAGAEDKADEMPVGNDRASDDGT